MAFQLSSDIPSTVTFTKTAVSGFDFNTKEKIEGVPVVSPIEAFIVASKKKSKKRNTMQKRLIMKAADLESGVSFYDYVMIDGLKWSIGPPIAINEAVISIEVFREV
ncbi:MAG: hypothetical protein OEX12_00115 [Gammaproteobacteria bacterium]|nr:hypothetical protein [Gammaproteobacteria bacterium]